MILLEVIGLNLELFKFLNDIRLIEISEGFDLVEIEDFTEELFSLLSLTGIETTQKGCHETCCLQSVRGSGLAVM